MSGFSKIKFGDGLSVIDEGGGVILVSGGGGTGTGGITWEDTGTGASSGGSPLTTKGDVYGYGSADARIPVGTNGQVLTADSAQTLGVKWATPAATGATGTFTVVSKTVDESVTSSIVLQDDDHLFFSTVSGGLYYIHCFLIYASPTGAGTPDLRVGFGEDAVATRGQMVMMRLETSDSAGQISPPAYTDQGTYWTPGTATTDRALFAWGYHLAGGGTFKLRWAQSISNAGATIVRAGSILRYQRVI